MKQLAAFFDGHYRKLTVGAANQQAVIAQINHAFDIFTQRREVDRAAGGERGDGDVENAAQAFTALVDIFHLSFLTAALMGEPGNPAGDIRFQSPPRFR
jgi:hypothetical protein